VEGGGETQEGVVRLPWSLAMMTQRSSVRLLCNVGVRVLYVLHAWTCVDMHVCTHVFIVSMFVRICQCMLIVRHVTRT